jgi:hypothetical protein
VPTNLTEQDVLTAIAVVAGAAGAAALLSRWHERTVTAAEVVYHITASPRLQRVAAFCAEAQGRAPVVDAGDLIRARAGSRRWRDRRCRP